MLTVYHFVYNIVSFKNRLFVESRPIYAKSKARSIIQKVHSKSDKTSHNKIFLGQIATNKQLQTAQLT